MVDLKTKISGCECSLFDDGDIEIEIYDADYCYTNIEELKDLIEEVENIIKPTSPPP